MIVKTEAVVLRGMKYKETSKILTLYTREYGKLSVIAKGCRGPKSTFGSSLEPMNYVAAVLYKKDDRDLQLLTQCDVIKPFRHLSEDMERLHAAMTIVAMLERATHPEENNERLFTMTVESLEVINDATMNSVHVLYKFEMVLLDLLGFRPNFHVCHTCQTVLRSVTTAGLHLASGGVLCASCARNWAGDGTISGPTLRALQHLQEADRISEVTSYPMPTQIRNEVQGVLRKYLQRHVGGLEVLKTEEVFAALL